MKKSLGILLAVVIAALVGFIVLGDSRPAAPAFALNNLQGQPINNDRLQGKVTLINFWYPSCPGCVSEMPKLVKMSQDYQGKDFQILAIAVPIDPLASVQEYVKQRQLPFDVMFDENKTVTKLFIKNELYPTSILLNKRGQILQQFVGEPNFKDLYQTVDGELAK